MSVYLVDRSGRERLSFADRVQWLRGEAQAIQCERARLGFGSEVHTLGVLLERMSSAGRIHPQATRPSVERRLRELALIECDVMAWRRGGARAVDDLHRTRRELDAWRTLVRARRVAWKYPLWGVGAGGETANPWVDLGEAGA